MLFKNLSEIFASHYYAVPDYQREYEWTIAENSTLLMDMFSLLENSNGNSKHFLGAIVTIPYEEDNGIAKSFSFSEYDIPKEDVRHLVDGQQRLTSLSILISVFKNMLSDDLTVNPNIKKNLESVLEGLLLGENFRASDYNKAPRLILNGNTGNCYNTDVLQVRGENVNHLYRGAKRILAANSYYERELKKKRDDLIEASVYATNSDFYRAFVDILTKKIQLVEIECDASSDAFQVFDSLNGKGLDLTAADRIKNILLSWAKPEDKALQKWDSIVASVSEGYLVSFFVALFFFKNEERISKNKLPEKFRMEYQISAKNNFSNFYLELSKYATLYGQLRQAKTAEPKINDKLLDFQQLGLDQVFVLLSAVAYSYENSDIFKTQYFNCMVDALVSLVVRMQICDMSMNGLDQLFKKCIKALKKALNNSSNVMQDAKEIQVVTDLLVSEKKKIEDKLFEEKFAYFSTSDNKQSEFYLRHIEEYLQKKNNNSRCAIPRNLTVEHIIPQAYDLNAWYGNTPVPPEVEADFSNEYVQNIGNKALLYGDDNTAASNNTYGAKLNVYKTGKRGQNNGTPIGTFVLISDLVQKYPTKFLHEEIFARAKELASYAKEIW